MLILVHSPLTGPLVWNPAEQELARHGHQAVVPEVTDHPSGVGPLWEQHARSVARSVRRLPAGERPVLVGHSGAGQLLPAIRRFSERPVRACLFVDAGLPEDGASRLDQIRRESPDAAAELEAHLAAGGRFPEWTDEDLREVVPPDGLRRGLLEELRPRPLAYFTEPIPVPGAWPDAPCGYLRLSAAYDPALEAARAMGWPTRSIDAGHFHMMVEPDEVVDELLSLLDEATSA